MCYKREGNFAWGVYIAYNHAYTLEMSQMNRSREQRNPDRPILDPVTISLQYLQQVM